MFGSYVQVALRVFMRNKLFSLINVGGLTIGLAAAFFIILFVKSEVGYDAWLPAAERTYTIETAFTAPGRAPKTLARAPLELRAAMTKDFPEIEHFTRLYAGTAPIKIGDNQFSEPAFRIEETFFDVFGLGFNEGNAASSLSAAGSVVITAEASEKYFAGQHAVDKVITVGGTDYRVSGVLAPLAGKSHLDFQILLFDGPDSLDIDFIDWTSARVYSYFTLESGASIAALETRAPAFLDTNAFFSPESWRSLTPSSVMALSFLPIEDIHLYQQGENPIAPGGSAALVFGFTGIAALILAMAGINFVNLSTAHATTREKETALRKLSGATRAQLIGRQLLEAILLVSFACLVALSLVEIFAPIVFSWIGMSGFGTVEFDASFLIIAVAASLGTAILAALYPAIQLSSKSLSTAFSSGRSQPPKVARFRLGLILSQYIISIVLVIIAGHFYLQTRFATSMDLGFDAENVVSYWGLRGAPNPQAQQALLANVRTVPGVASSTRLAQLPGGGQQNNVGLTPVGAESTDGITSIQAIAADVGFDTTLDMTLLAGRAFEATRSADAVLIDPEQGTSANNYAASIIVNQLAAQALGYNNPADALGTTFQMQDYINGQILVEIVGVVKNAHFQTIHSPLVPMLFINAEPFFSALSIKLQPGSQQETLARLDTLWENYVPAVPVLKTYLRQDLAEQYAIEDRMTQVFSVFAALAVVIAFLGIFGLAAFNVERRTKEVGIRKVLGATVAEIVRLFVWQFSKPVLVASIIAWPIAGILVQSWLESFAYRIDLIPLVFISAGGTVLLIAALTVASHAARAAMISPILALRHE